MVFRVSRQTIRRLVQLDAYYVGILLKTEKEIRMLYAVWFRLSISSHRNNRNTDSYEYKDYITFFSFVNSRISFLMSLLLSIEHFSRSIQRTSSCPHERCGPLFPLI